jgi:hypothetical protein
MARTCPKAAGAAAGQLGTGTATAAAIQFGMPVYCTGIPAGYISGVFWRTHVPAGLLIWLYTVVAAVANGIWDSTPRLVQPADCQNPA